MTALGFTCYLHHMLNTLIGLLTNSSYSAVFGLSTACQHTHSDFSHAYKIINPIFALGTLCDKGLYFSFY